MNAGSLPPSPAQLQRRRRDSAQGRAQEAERAGSVSGGKANVGYTTGSFGLVHSSLDYRLALIVWLILGIAVSVRTGMRPSSHTVFPIFAASAQHWWGNRSLYDLYAGLDRFRYPPVFALFVTPFSALGLTTGGILWSWLSIVVFVAGLWLYVRDVLPSQWTGQRRAVFLMLGALGALRGLWNAQSNALIAGFILLGSAALARAAREAQNARHAEGMYQTPDKRGTKDWWLAAAFLAVAVCLKLTPLAPVLLLVVLWPRQLVWRLLVIIAGLFLLPFVTRPPAIVLDHYGEWIEHLRESGNIRWIGFRDGWTIWIVLHHWLGSASGALRLGEPMASSWYRLVQLGAAAAVLGWCLWQRHRAVRLALGPRWLIHVSLSMGLAWLMLFGPAVEHATYVFLAPPLLWALLEAGAWPNGRGLIWASFTLIMVLGWGAITRMVTPDWPIVLTALPAGTALFALWLAGYARNCGIENQKQPLHSDESRSTAHEQLTSCTERWDETTILS